MALVTNVKNKYVLLTAQLIMKYVFYQFGSYSIRILFLIFLFSCREHSVKEDTVLSDSKIISDVKPSVKLNNSAIFVGSTFGEFFQILHKTGNYSEMLVYTSSKTKKQFSNTELLDFYQNMQFSYPLNLKAIDKQINHQVLLYKTTINATKKTIQFNVVVENDTCRALFEKLDTKNPFIGM